MKKLILIVAIGIFTVNAFTQTVAPMISFEKNTHNFGKIKEEAGTVTYKFNFVNTGGSPLLIDTVRATCGCTAPDWTRKPIPPGGSGYVAATYNPAGRPSAFSKYLYVTSNSNPASTKLTIKGEVIAKPRTVEDDFRYSMGALRLKVNHLAFGNVSNTAKKDYQLEVVNNSDEKITLGFEMVPDHLNIRFEPAVLSPGQRGLILAKYDASLKGDWGMIIDRVNVTVNGVSDRNFRLVVSANIVEDFSSLTASEMAAAPVAKVDNPEVNFGQMKQNAKFEHSFILTNTGQSQLYIRKIKAACGCTAVQPEKMEIAPGESVNIKTIFNSAGKRGNQNKTVTIITNDPKHSNLILRIKGEVLAG